MILKNKTQSNFTMINNQILKDKDLKLIDRGLLCTLCSFPDNWNFSIAGLAAILPDGKTSITASLQRLEECGYLSRSTVHGADGRFETIIEIFVDGDNSHSRFSDMDKPASTKEDGFSDSENLKQYRNTISDSERKTNSEKSIILPGEEERACLLKAVANNIELDSLLEIASTHDASEVELVKEVYSTIVDMVSFPRETVTIKGTTYPWDAVKKRFLSLRKIHISNVLNKIIDSDLAVKNMHSYLISTLYTEALTGNLSLQSEIADDYLKTLRGKPY